MCPKNVKKHVFLGFSNHARAQVPIFTPKLENLEFAWLARLRSFLCGAAGLFCVPPRLYSSPPMGGHRRPTFYSRRFCRSVCRRTKSFRRSRTVKGNFVWGSYGGFSAGSWRVLGTFSAESRQDLPKGAKRKPKGAKREPKGSQREPKRMYHLSPLAMSPKRFDRMYHFSLLTVLTG